jgi:hypothetical protein
LGTGNKVVAARVHQAIDFALTILVTLTYQHRQFFHFSGNYQEIIVCTYLNQ